ncbi:MULTISPECIES: hypothetical protein [Acidiphilium]|uniref:DUF1440 domain-containing protein n=1 Tax=Acidiphilium rubrum TaxID=526 RepID=A0A8G2FI78_ACIRU|nr:MULTISPECIES: hypothetical protein [Acidiphilium]MCW8308732.1 hypothetical protein [Acidiphilium sp. PA]SIR52107.1 hypothetical protein SAMN05421828_1456 [Acidiphilium rubrum]
MNGQYPRPRITRRLWTGLAAGAIAIVINSFILFAADWIPLVTAHGGLLKLIKPFVAGPLQTSGVASLWRTLDLPAPQTMVFKIGFHIAVGLAMAVAYAFIFEPVLRGPAWLKGLLYAAFAWIMNAFIVLPWIGEGIAGSRNLSLAGMAYFAFAHTVFFVLLAILYAQFMNGRTTTPKGLSL